MNLFERLSLITSFFFLLFWTPSAAFSSHLPDNFALQREAMYNLPFKADSYAGIVWADGKLYVGTYEGKIHQMSITKENLIVEHTSDLGSLRVSSLAWDGNNLWACVMGTGNIIRLKNTSYSLAVDNIFDLPGADTYPYAMTFYKESLFVGGHSETLNEYKILSKNHLEIVDQRYLGKILRGLTSAEGRLFTTMTDSRYGIIEIKGKKESFFPIEDLNASAIAIAYNEQAFWLLSQNKLYKYKIVPAKKTDLPTKLQGRDFNLEGYAYSPKRPMSLAWDGNSLWTAKDISIYQHQLDPHLSVKNTPKFIGGNVNLRLSYGGLSWDGANFATTGSKVVDFGKKTNYLIRLRQVLDADILSLKVISEEELPVFGDIGALTWIDGKLWVSTGQQTRTSGEGSFFHELEKGKNGRWKLVKTYKAPGSRCQGLAWDGMYLWSYDVFEEAFFKHKMDDELTIVEKYSEINGERLMYFSGLAWDGQNLWTGNYRYDKIYKISFGDANETKPRNIPGYATNNVDILHPELYIETQMHDENNNELLEGGEKIGLLVTVTNNGEGIAEGVRIRLQGGEGLNILPMEEFMGIIKPFIQQQKLFSGTVKRNISGGKIKLEVIVTEKTGIKKSVVIEKKAEVSQLPSI